MLLKSICVCETEIEKENYAEDGGKKKRLSSNDEDIASVGNIVPRCPMCRRELPSISALTRHFLKAHVSKTTVKCNICGQMLSNQGNYRRHLRNVHQVVEET